jgi:transcriptional regulator with XRE-family HTH domain
MDDARIGRALRMLRQRRGLRQSDIAAIAGVSQSSISLVERGHSASLAMTTLRRVFGAVDAGFEGLVLWRGGGLDRLLDEGHARLVSSMVARLRFVGWNVQVEVTYSVFGERGSIDVLAAHDPTRTVLAVEVKTELTSIEQTGRKIDEKARIAGQHLGSERFGWRPRAIGRLLALPGTDAARRTVAQHSILLTAAFPSRGKSVRAWLRKPSGDMAGLLFVSDASPHSGSADRRGVSRVRRPRAILPGVRAGTKP